MCLRCLLRETLSLLEAFSGPLLNRSSVVKASCSWLGVMLLRKLEMHMIDGELFVFVVVFML